MATFRRLSADPSFDLLPQTTRVEPGTLQYGYGRGGDAIVDYAQFRPRLSAGSSEIPQSLRESSFGGGNLRPLMRMTPGTRSADEMERDAGLIDQLDDYYSTGPLRRRTGEAQLEAEAAKAEATARDPLFEERGKFDMLMAQRAFELDQAARLANEKNEAQFNSYDSFVDEDTASQLDELRRHPSYISASPEKRAAAEAALAEEARQKKAEIRKLKLAGYPRDFTLSTGSGG